MGVPGLTLEPAGASRVYEYQLILFFTVELRWKYQPGSARGATTGFASSAAGDYNLASRL